MRPTVTIVSLIRKTTHANTQQINSQTLFDWNKCELCCWTEWFRRTTAQHPHAHHKNTKKKPESWDELSKPPATQSLSSRARVTTHTNLETHVCVHPQSEADETTITADGLILPHTHTHIHNSNLPSANNRAVCGEKRKGGVEWHEEQIRQIMVEGNAVRCWTGFIYSDKHE